MRRMTSLALWLGLSMAVSGCYSSATEPLADGGTAATGDGSTAADGGSASCDAQDAIGDGLCDAVLGWSFDGDRCVMQSGCECTGADCDSLFASEAACELTYAECLEPVPGPCDAQDARGQGACRAILGVIWDGRQCATIGGCECVGADCGELFASTDECELVYAACGPDRCAEQELPNDDCDGPPQSFGWRWDGGACEEVWRCGCSGASCDALYANERECAGAYGSCPAAATNCDPNDTFCRAFPPVCRDGEVPSVIDSCWGPCVPFAECGPIACGSDLRECPARLRCSDGMCVR